MTPTVLLTDGHWNKTVAAIRSLHHSGLKVFVGETSRLAAGMLSRYPANRFITPSPLVQPKNYIDSIISIIEKNKPDVLMPMELTTMLLLSEHRHRFTGLCGFPFAHHDILLKAASKIAATKAAIEAGIPAPQSLPLTSSTSSQDIIDQLGSSLVIKPDFGEGGRGLFYCSSRAELAEAKQHIPKDAMYLAQKRIPQGGAGLGVSILMDEKQQVLASFGHKRLREYPVDGGPSTCRQAIHHAQAEEDAITLLKHLGFSGIAMVEFKEDPTSGQAVFLEINPRFWGSLPLAIRAGVDFPTLLYKWAMGIEFQRPKPVLGTTVRNILPGDILHFIAQKGRVAREFWDFRTTSDDLLSLSDPGPSLGRLISPLVALYDPQLKSVFKKRQSQ